MRLRQQQKEQVRAALIRAGLDLITRKGFAAATVDEITQLAGVSKGTYYNYFKTKEDFVVAAVIEVQSAGESEVDQLIAACPTTRERVQALFTPAVAYTQTHPELIWIWCLERLRALGAATSSETPDPFHGLLARVLAFGQGTGEVRTDRTAAEMAYDLEGLFLVHIALWYHQGAGQPLQQLVGPAVDTYLQGAVHRP